MAHWCASPASSAVSGTSRPCGVAHRHNARRVDDLALKAIERKKARRDDRARRVCQQPKPRETGATFHFHGFCRRRRRRGRLDHFVRRHRVCDGSRDQLCLKSFALQRGNCPCGACAQGTEKEREKERKEKPFIAIAGPSFNWESGPLEAKKARPFTAQR